MAVVGEPDEVQLRAYDVAVRAQSATAEAMRAGVRVMDVHEAVKRFYESEGFEYKRAFIGHSIGIGCHEFPFLGPSHADWVLEAGMIFEVEPGVTIGNTRVHTEDTYLITEEKPQILSNYKDTSRIQIIK
jgi:Xaa-Pro aminopeptidase